MSKERISDKIVADCNDAIMFADCKGVIRLWNSGAEKMFGYTLEEAIGRSLDLIIPENLRERHWEGYFRVVARGSSRYSTDQLSAPAMHKNGTRISTEFSMVIVKSETGEVAGIAAIVRDVTARWLREKELKDQIRKLEAERT